MDSLVTGLKLPLLVFLGGGIGAFLRWLCGRLFPCDSQSGFPWTTLAINTIGSFVLGLCVVLLKDRPGWLTLVGVGMCGGFTTFSTFSVEVVRLLESGRLFAAVGYALVSVFVSVLAAGLGIKLLR